MSGSGHELGYARVTCPSCGEATRFTAARVSSTFHCPKCLATAPLRGGPPSAEIRTDDGACRDDAVFWLCECGQVLEADRSAEGCVGSCPTCSRSHKVPRRAEVGPFDRSTGGGLRFACRGCGAAWASPADHAYGWYRCPRCSTVSRLVVARPPAPAASGLGGWLKRASGAGRGEEVARLSAALGLSLADAEGADFGTATAAEALNHVVGVLHPTLGSGGEIDFAFLCDGVSNRVRRASYRRHGIVRPADFPVRVASTPIVFVHWLRDEWWGGLHEKSYYPSLGLGRGSDHLLNMSPFVARNNSEFPDNPWLPRPPAEMVPIFRRMRQVLDAQAADAAARVDQVFAERERQRWKRCVWCQSMIDRYAMYCPHCTRRVG